MGNASSSTDALGSTTGKEPLVRLKQTLHGHKDTVTSISYSQDGQYIVTSSSDGTAKLWNSETGKLLQTYRGHTWTCWCVKLSNHNTLNNPNSFVVSTSSDCTVNIWDTITGAIIHTIQDHTEPVYCADISSDNRYIATGSVDETCRLFSGIVNDNYNALQIFVGHRGAIFAVAFTSDVRHLVSASDDKTVKLWGIGCGTLIRTFTGHKSRVLSVCVSFDNNYIVSSSSDHKAILWNISNGLEMRRYTGHAGAVSCVTMPSFDDSLVVTGSYEKSVKIWNRRTGTQMHTFQGHHNYVTSVVFNPTNKAILATGSDDKCVKIWDLSELPIIRDMTWNIVRHFIMLRWLLCQNRALSKNIKADLSSSITALNNQQEVIHRLMKIEIDDVFRHIISFLIPQLPTLSSQGRSAIALETINDSVPPPLSDE